MVIKKHKESINYIIMKNLHIRTLVKIADCKPVENPSGVLRTTLAFNDATMMCHFFIKKGAVIPLHNHKAVQNGYVVKGKLQFFKNEGPAFIADAGSGYLFEKYEFHGVEAMENSEVVECFSPARREYADI